MLFLVAISDSVSRKVISTPPVFKKRQALKDTEWVASAALFIELLFSRNRHSLSNRHVWTHRQSPGSVLTGVVKSS
jgi:hypothetical protein